MSTKPLSNPHSSRSPGRAVARSAILPSYACASCSASGSIKPPARPFLSLMKHATISSGRRCARIRHAYGDDADNPRCAQPVDPMSYRWGWLVRSLLRFRWPVDRLTDPSRPRSTWQSLLRRAFRRRALQPSFSDGLPGERSDTLRGNGGPKKASPPTSSRRPPTRWQPKLSTRRRRHARSTSAP